MGKREDVEIIDLLIRKQELLTELYLLFAGHYPGHRDFWLEIARHEEEHAKWLASFRRLMAEGKICYCPGNTSRHAIEALVRYLSETIERFSQAPFPLQRALAVAMDIERSLVIRKAFDCFDGYNRDIRKLLRILQESKALNSIKIEAAHLCQSQHGGTRRAAFADRH